MSGVTLLTPLVNMLEPVLQSLREVEGVQGVIVVDPSAAVLAYRAHAIYDAGVLQQVARAAVSTTTAAQLVHDDWELLTAHFGDGKLLFRNLRTSGARPRRYLLAVIGDSTLNLAFLGVALRVAASKLVGELEAGPPGSRPLPVARASGRRLPEPQRPEPARAALSWSGARAATAAAIPEIGVADSASSAFLSACTKALAASLGPTAKALVKEAVRKVCGERTFSRSDRPAVLAELVAAIGDSDDRAVFQRATRNL